MVSLIAHPPNVVLTYLLRGEAGLSEVADRVEEAAHEQPGGKFSKSRAAYLPQAPVPPTLWRTSCGRCRFWEPGAPGEPGQCHVVGREGDRFGGEAIHYRGWCGFWMPPEGEPALAWIGERLRPEGATSVRGEYDTELTEKERRREEGRREGRADASSERDARQVPAGAEGRDGE